MLGLFVASVLFGVALSQECDTIITDECGIEALHFLTNPESIPSNEAELQEVCKVLNEGATCFKNFLTKCPSVLKKETADALLDSLQQTVLSICTGSLGKRIIPHGSCLKEKVVKDFNACDAETTNIAEAISVSEPASDRLKHLCCAYLNLDKCLADSSKSACDERASRTVRNIVQSYALFLVDKCLPFLSAPENCNLTPFKEAKPSARNPKTFLPGLIDIVAVALA